MFALAGSAATAESPLTGENAKELERLLRVPAENVIVLYSLRKVPRIPADTLDRFLMWNGIALDTTAIDHTPGSSKRRIRAVSVSSSVQLWASYALAIVHIAMFDAENAITKRYVSYSGIPPVRGTYRWTGPSPRRRTIPWPLYIRSKGAPRRDF